MSAEWLMFTPVLKIEDIVMKENEIKAKARAIAGQLTLEEKIGMIHGSHLFATKGVERLGIPPLVMSDGPMGVRQELSLIIGKQSAIRMIMLPTFPVIVPWRPHGTGNLRLPWEVFWGKKAEEGARM